MTELLWWFTDFLVDDAFTWLFSVLFGVALKSAYDSSKKAVAKRCQRRERGWSVGV